MTSVGNSVFSGCSSLASVELPNGLENIGATAFSGCSSLASLTIPSAVTAIGNNALDGCTGLKNLVIDGSIATMGTNVFNSCNPTYVKIDGNITGTSSTFQNKTSVEEVVIGENVNTLYNLFSGFTGLTKLTFGENLEYVRNDAFKGCTGLKEVISKNVAPPYCYPDVFSGIQTENCLLSVPSSSVVSYQSTEPWNGFGTLTAYDLNTELVEIIDGTEYSQSYDIAVDKITYTRAFNNTSWQSLYVPFEITVTEDLLNEFDFAYINAARQYDYDDDGEIDNLTIEVFKVKNGTLRANHPYLIRAKSTGSKTITVNDATLFATASNSVTCSATSLSFTFKGAYETLTYDDLAGCRLLGGGEWKTPSATATMKPMRFYMKIESRGSDQIIPAASSATPIRMTVVGEDGDATEIIPTPNPSREGGEFFDLQGRRVEHPENGIYIINGKKVIVK